MAKPETSSALRPWCRGKRNLIMTGHEPCRSRCTLALAVSFSALLTWRDTERPTVGQARSPNPSASTVDLPPPTLPRHQPHIRIAMLAYGGNPMGAFEDELMRSSVDVVVSDLAYLKHLHDLAPATPLLAYTNTSNLYLDLLTDWLAFADRKGVSREVAFFHAAVPKHFKGNSPSSRPVTWFWSVLRGGGRTFTDLGTDAHKASSQVQLARAGDALYLGYPDPFREINVTLSVAGRDFQVVPEYCAGVDGAGCPTAWQALSLIGDTTAGLTRSGQITFDPPRQWKPASINRSAAYFYVRLRTIAGTPPIASSVLGRDFVDGKGTTSGVIPVFDSAADTNGDGYLDDAEYARRAPGKDARFRYESRMVTGWYGAMRFLANPAHAAFQEWAAEHCKRLLDAQPTAAGLFMDNSNGKLYLKPGDILEPIGPFPEQYGRLLAAIHRTISPRWILSNTEGGDTDADTVIRHNPAYLEEFALRPLVMHWLAFEEVAGRIERRARLSAPPPLAVIDTHPEGGAPDDPRTQMAALSAYYLIADPDSTCLMLFGGAETATTWRRHWTPAAAYPVGRPQARFTRYASGSDPVIPGLSYRVYSRSYEKALVLYRPLSGTPGKWAVRGGLGDDTASHHELGMSYRPLQADGTLGAPVTRITLRGGEGAVLIRTNADR
jgi:hypothetical protein